MVEAAGVEPASENDPPRASTCLASSEVLSTPGPGRAEDLASSPLFISSSPRGRSGETSRLLGVLAACHRRGLPQDVATIVYLLSNRCARSPAPPPPPLSR